MLLKFLLCTETQLLTDCQLIGWMTHILHTSTVHKTASLADEGNSAYCKSSCAHNIKHNLWKLTSRGHLNTMEHAGTIITKDYEYRIKEYTNTFVSKL